MSIINKINFVFVLFIVLVLGSLNARAQFIPETSDDRIFSAGAAKLDITSPLGSAPVVGGWAPAPAVHVNDPLHVRTLALNDGETTLVLAICDLLGVDRKSTRLNS